jgi:hypothetical protein
LLWESIEDRFHRQQGYTVKRVKTDRNKHESVKLAQQRCWVLNMAFFLYPPQVASSKCMLGVMFLPEIQGFSDRSTLCRTYNFFSTWSLHTRTTRNCWLLTKSRRGQYHEARLRCLHPAGQQPVGNREEKDYTYRGSIARSYVSVAPLLRPRMAGLYVLPPPPPPRMGEHNALNEDQVLKMTTGNVCFIECF